MNFREIPSGRESSEFKRAEEAQQLSRIVAAFGALLVCAGFYFAHVAWPGVALVSIGVAGEVGVAVGYALARGRVKASALLPQPVIRRDRGV